MGKTERWQGIAGGVEEGETYLEACKREANEEAGINCNAPVVELKSISTMPVVNVTKDFLWGENVYLIYEHCFGIDATNETITLSHEHKKMEWLSYEDAKNENYYINLKILNFDFQIGDKVVYMVIAPNTQKYYPLFQGTDNAVIDITSNNIGLKAEVRIKPLNYFVNVGTYTVLATIIHNGEQFSTNYIDIEIDLPAESNYQLQISYQEIKGNQNELSTYYLSAKIFLNSEQINADNMLISWYLQNNNEPFRRMNSDFEWKPEEPGIYTISAKIEGLASGLTIESKNPIVITAVYNNSSTIFMWIGIIVGVAVLGLVVVIIIKVKSEKVW